MRHLAFFLTLCLASLICNSLALAATVKNGAFEYETGAAPDWVLSEPFPKEWPAKFAASAPFRVWRLDEQITVPDGEYVDYAWQPGNSKAVETAAQYSVDFDPSWQRLVVHELTLKRGAKWVDRLTPEVITLARREEQFEGMGFTGRVSALIVLPDVRVEDVIRIRYSLLGAHPLLKDVATASTFYLEHNNPILQRRIRVLGKDLRYELSGEAKDAKISSTPTEFSLAREQVSARVWVDQMPNEMSAFARLRVAPRASWSAVNAWAVALFDLKATPEVKALAKKIATEAGADPKRRALLATRYVQDQIRYFAVHLGESTHRPHSPKKVLSVGYGDCKDKAQLLTIMLRELGIEAYPVLVHSARGVGIVKELPSASAFDHAIVMARIADKDYWLDATWTQQGGDLDSAGFPDYKNALVLKQDTVALTPMLPVTKGNDVLAVVERFDARQPGEIKLEVSTDWRGASAESMRASRANNGDEKIQENYKQAYARSLGKVLEANLKFQDEREQNRLQAQESYTFTPFWTRSGDYEYADFQASTLGQALELPQQTERTQPLAQALPMVLTHTLELQLPEGAEVPTPKNIEIKDPAFLFSRSASNDNGVLKVRFRYESLSERIEQNIEQHLQHRRDARDALSVRLSYRLADPTADRKARMRKLMDALGESPAAEPKSRAP